MSGKNMKYWVCNFYDEKHLKYGLKNNLFLMQYQYGKEERVSDRWKITTHIKEGDWLIAYTKPKTFWAIGKACKPRAHLSQTDSIDRTIKDKKHNYLQGTIGYKDTDVFYENLDQDNGFGGEWGQRIDVDNWINIQTKALSYDKEIQKFIIHGITQDPIFGIDKELFDRIKRELEMLNLNVFASLITNLAHPQVILTGPPGTSKTYEAKRIAASILGYPQDAAIDSKNPFFKDEHGKKWNMIQFHPAYNYEDFVRGIQISTDSAGKTQYKTVNRIFAQMALAAYKDWNNWENWEKSNKPEAAPKYVLIIDEINRAHLAAVLGELIYGLEYRGSKVTTPYAVTDPKDRFDNKDTTLIVPPNLYIIGTMNTADRSIGHIDYAVRRRFTFIPLLPDKPKLVSYYDGKNFGHAQKAESLFDAVSALFASENDNLSSEFHADDVQPGHTYFMAETCEELGNKFVYQVYPLLREYIKDGILIGKEIQLKLDTNLSIEPVMNLHDLEKAIKEFLNCSQSSTSIT